MFAVYREQLLDFQRPNFRPRKPLWDKQEPYYDDQHDDHERGHHRNCHFHIPSRRVLSSRSCAVTWGLNLSYSSCPSRTGECRTAARGFHSATTHIIMAISNDACDSAAHKAKCPSHGKNVLSVD